MQCKNCKTSFSQHELRNDLCLQCTGKELANARVYGAHLEDGLRASEEELAATKAQLADTLARERQLREALERIKVIYTRDGWQNTPAAIISSDTLTTPAPRVFTAEEVRPLVEALHWMELTDAAHSAAARTDCKLCKALEHAHKLGMEGGE